MEKGINFSFYVWRSFRVMGQTTTERLHILLADDDEEDRELFEEFIGQLNISATIAIAKNGDDLMKQLSGYAVIPPPHIIFLDINMPKKNGIECLVEIRNNQKYDGLSVFMFSTSRAQFEIDKSFENGANLYVLKDTFFSLSQDTIEQLLSGWKKYLQKVSRKNFVLQS